MKSFFLFSYPFKQTLSDVRFTLFVDLYPIDELLHITQELINIISFDI